MTGAQPRARPRRRLAHIPRLGDRATAAIEFALIGPVLLMMLMAALDIALTIFVLLSIESAALEAARYGATGQIPAGSTREQQIRQIISDGAFGLVDPDELSVETRVYESFAQLAAAERLYDLDGDGALDVGETFDDVDGDGAWDGDPGAPGAGVGEDIVLYRVSTLWRPLTPLAGPIIGDIQLSAAIPMRNEPF